MMNFNNPLEDRLESIEKEYQLLNQLINSKSTQVDHLHEIKYDLFKESLNKEILRLILSLNEEDKDINLFSLRSQVKLKMNPVQLSQYDDHIDILNSYVPTDTFVNLMKDLDTLRKNRILFEEILGTAKTKFINNEPIEEIIQDITESIISMDTNKEDRTTYEEHVQNTLKMITDPDKYSDYLKLRLEEWNKNLGGVIKDRYYLIGGESGSGKTSLICEIMGQLSEDHKDRVAILFFSYEMSQERIVTRLISRRVRFTESKLKQRTKKLNPEDLDVIKKEIKVIQDYPLEIVYQTLSDKELRMRARRFALKNKGKHLIIILDHMGLVDSNERDMRVMTIKTSKVMKSFATDYKASVFALTQLKKELTDTNSPSNKTSFHRPNDSHIMESGSVKADADAVILLWRPDMRFSHINYDGHSDFDVRKKLFLLNYKNRDGQSPTDMVFGCDIKYNALYNLEDPFSPGMVPSVKEEMEQQALIAQEMGIETDLF